MRKVARGGRKLRAVSADGARLMGAREVLQRGSEVGGTSGHTLLARGLLSAHLPGVKRTGVTRYHAERVKNSTPRDALPLGDQTGQVSVRVRVRVSVRLRLRLGLRGRCRVRVRIRVRVRVTVSARTASLRLPASSSALVGVGVGVG